MATVLTPGVVDSIRRRTFTNLQTKQLDTNGFQHEVTITTSTKDRYGDIVESSGALTDNFMLNPVVMWAHSYGTPPIGRALELTKKKNSIVASFEFTPEGMFEFADQIRALWNGRFLNAVSIGFMPTQWEEIEDSWSFKFTEWELLEFSIVPVPANAEALRKALNGVSRETGRRILVPKDFDIGGRFDPKVIEQDVTSESDVQTDSLNIEVAVLPPDFKSMLKEITLEDLCDELIERDMMTAEYGKLLVKVCLTDELENELTERGFSVIKEGRVLSKATRAVLAQALDKLGDAAAIISELIVEEPEEDPSPEIIEDDYDLTDEEMERLEIAVNEYMEGLE